MHLSSRLEKYNTPRNFSKQWSDYYLHFGDKETEHREVCPLGLGNKQRCGPALMWPTRRADKACGLGRAKLLHQEVGGWLPSQQALSIIKTQGSPNLQKKFILNIKMTGIRIKNNTDSGNSCVRTPTSSVPAAQHISPRFWKLWPKRLLPHPQD